MVITRVGIISLIGNLLVTACSVGPNYVRPQTEVPSSYKELAGWKQAEPLDHIARGTWWEIFQDPVLNSLEEQVLVSNQTIAQAEAQFRQSRALVRIARSGYFPTISGDATIARSSGPGGAGSVTSKSTGTAGTGPVTGSMTGSGQTDYVLSFDAVWELDLWGKVRRNVEANIAGLQASIADLESARLSMQATLAQDYFQLRTLERQKQILDETIVALEKSCELTQNRYAAGVSSRADVLQAETQLRSTQAQAIDVGVQRSQMEHAIAVLLGKPPAALSVPAGPLPASPPPVPTGIPSDLLERRPDIAAAERRMAAANAQIGVVMAAYYPALALRASAGFEDTSLSKLLTLPNGFWSLGPSLSETLFSGGLRGAQVEQARASYDAAAAVYRQTVLAGFQEVEDNLAALRILEQEARVQDEAVQAARQSVAIARNQYKTGLIGYLNVIVVQTAALTNERTAVDILGRRLNATVLLIKAVGGGWSALDEPKEPVQTRPAGTKAVASNERAPVPLGR